MQRNSDTNISNSNDVLSSVTGVIILVLSASIVVFFEYILLFLHEISNNSPFVPIILRVEKELIIAGITAFILRLIQSSTSLPSSVYEAINFAEIIIPVFSFCYCGAIIGLVLLSYLINRARRQVNNLSTIELLIAYNKDYQKSLLSRLLIEFELVGTSRHLRLRVYKIIFLDLYGICPQALIFDDYIFLIFEKLMQDMADIRTLDWTVICILLVLNMLRSAVHPTKCSQPNAPNTCRNLNIKEFAGMGFLLFFVLLLIFIIMLRFHYKILALYNIQRWKDVPLFLLNQAERNETIGTTFRSSSHDATLSESSKRNMSTRSVSFHENSRVLLNSDQIKLLSLRCFEKNEDSSQRTRSLLLRGLANWRLDVKWLRVSLSKLLINCMDFVSHPSSVSTFLIQESSKQDKFDVPSFHSNRAGHRTSARLEEKIMRPSTLTITQIRESLKQMEESPTYMNPVWPTFSVISTPIQKIIQSSPFQKSSQPSKDLSAGMMTNKFSYDELDEREHKSGKRELKPTVEHELFRSEGDERTSSDNEPLADDLRLDIKVSPDENALWIESPQSITKNKINNPGSNKVPLIKRRLSQSNMSEIDIQPMTSNGPYNANDLAHSELDGRGSDKPKLIDTSSLPSIASSKKRVRNQGLRLPNSPSYELKLDFLKPLEVENCESHPSGTRLKTDPLDGAAISSKGSNTKGVSKMFGIGKGRVRSWQGDVDDDDSITDSSVTLKPRDRDQVLRPEQQKHILINGEEINFEAREKDVLEVQQKIIELLPFGSPSLYVGLIQLVLALLSFNLTLWLIVFSNCQACDLIWKVISLLVCLFGFVLFTYTVKGLVVMMIFAPFDYEVILRSLEKMEANIALEKEIRSSIISYINQRKGVSDQQLELFNLFCEMDFIGNNAVPFVAFDVFLRRVLKINKSESNIRLIFQRIDQNGDGKVSFQDFLLFVFPENEVAKGMQQDRLDKVNEQFVTTTVKEVEDQHSARSAPSPRIKSSNRRFSFDYINLSHRTHTATQNSSDSSIHSSGVGSSGGSGSSSGKDGVITITPQKLPSKTIVIQSIAMNGTSISPSYSLHRKSLNLGSSSGSSVFIPIREATEEN